MFLFPENPAIVLCLPVENEKLISRVLKELEAVRTSRTDNSLFLLVHPEGPGVFLPTTSEKPVETLFDNSTNTTATSMTRWRTSISATKRQSLQFPSRFPGRVKNLLAFAPFDKRLETFYRFLFFSRFLRETHFKLTSFFTVHYYYFCSVSPPPFF